MNWYKISQSNDFLDDLFQDVKSRKEISRDPPKVENVTLELYRGCYIDPAKLNQPSIILSPKNSEQGLLWFTHKLINSYNPLEYVQGRGNFILTYPLQCKRHMQTVRYDDGSTYDIVPEIAYGEATDNHQFYMGYELPEGWLFSYKYEKFIVCNHDLTITPDMLKPQSV